MRWHRAGCIQQKYLTQVMGCTASSASNRLLLHQPEANGNFSHFLNNATPLPMGLLESKPPQSEEPRTPVGLPGSGPISCSYLPETSPIYSPRLKTYPAPCSGSPPPTNHIGQPQPAQIYLWAKIWCSVANAIPCANLLSSLNGTNVFLWHTWAAVRDLQKHGSLLWLHTQTENISKNLSIIQIESLEH